METNVEQITPESAHRPSSLGIAAFIIGGVLLCIQLGYLGFIYAYAIGLIPRTNDIPIPLLVIVATGTGCLLSPLVFILGVIALFQKNRKKLFALLGIVMSLLGLVLTILCFFSFFLFTS